MAVEHASVSVQAYCDVCTTLNSKRGVGRPAKRERTRIPTAQRRDAFPAVEAALLTPASQSYGQQSLQHASNHGLADAEAACAEAAEGE